jgi:hypothetical protein
MLPNERIPIIRNIGVQVIQAVRAEHVADPDHEVKELLVDHQLVLHDEQQAREDGHACEPEVAREAILVHDASAVGTVRYYEDDDGLN